MQHPVLDILRSEAVEVPPHLERGSNSPYASVEYDIPDSHIHHVPLGGGTDRLGIEEAAELLSEAILSCSEAKHDGHGRTHTQEDAEKAYHSAVFQLLTRNYDQEWVDLQQKIRAFKRWGGHPPKVVLMPSELDKQRWQMMVTTLEGTPHMTEITNSANEDLRSVIEVPNDTNSVKAPIGYYRKPHWTMNRRLAHLRNSNGY